MKAPLRRFASSPVGGAPRAWQSEFTGAADLGRASFNPLFSQHHLEGPNIMKKLLTALALAPMLLVGALAHAQAHSDKETKEDIARPRAMAAAHEAAAKCLDAGKGEDVCQKDLQTACKGLAIGTYCGMKHAH